MVRDAPAAEFHYQAKPSAMRRQAAPGRSANLRGDRLKLVTKSASGLEFPAEAGEDWARGADNGPDELRLQ
jgi:hypothetical protein